MMVCPDTATTMTESQAHAVFIQFLQEAEREEKKKDKRRKC
jgi:hypothetical protein